MSYKPKLADPFKTGWHYNKETLYFYKHWTHEILNHWMKMVTGVTAKSDMMIYLPYSDVYFRHFESL